jgi:hypothetical protein
MELQRAARNYITIHSRVDRSRVSSSFLLPLASQSLFLPSLRPNKTLYLPELFKWYSKDYGGTPKEMLQAILSLLGKDHSLHDEICQFIELKKPTLVFIPFDWKFQLVI